MAYERISDDDVYTARAAADLSTNRYCAVARVAGANPPRVVLAGAKDPNYAGVAQMSAASGIDFTVAHSGITKMVAGAAIPLPNRVTMDAQGRAVAAVSGDHSIGMAEIGALAAGDIISVNLDLDRTI